MSEEDERARWIKGLQDLLMEMPASQLEKLAELLFAECKRRLADQLDLTCKPEDIKH